MATRTAHAALSAHLKAMPGAPPIAFENVKGFKPPSDGSPWLTEHFISGGRDYSALGETGSSRDSGFYQVGISAPSGVGSGAAEELADRIIQHFTSKTLAGAVRTKLATSESPREDGGRLYLPVSVPFFVETFFRTQE